MSKIIKYLTLIFALTLCSCNFNINNRPNGRPPFNNDQNIDVEEPDRKEDDTINANPGEVEVSTDYKITYISGTNNAYSISENTITFNEITNDSIYQITGSLEGNIVIDIKNDYKLELELNGFVLSSKDVNPITILSGNEIKLTAKNGTVNYIYDYREKIDDTDSTKYSACIYSLVDLDLSGKGKLEVYSENNNGIHTKDDLKVKNLSLDVVCMDNALKGNDSVIIESGVVKLVAKAGDGIKTTNSHINSNENQKGTINIQSASVEVYAACDGIDSSYDVVIDNDNAIVNIYTDKYSGYSDVVTDTTEGFYYIRTSSSVYNYSIKYLNSQTGEYQWENASYSSQIGRYYYYKINKPVNFDKLILYIYASNQTLGQENSYYKSYSMTINNSYDTLSLSSSRNTCSWTNYSTSTQSQGPGGFGGMNEGNTDKGDYSTKGIKADNQIIITAGEIKINSYDDSIHANSETTLENGKVPLGNITISGGNLTLYSNDDGIHAEGTLLVSGGNIAVTNSYEGAEGLYVKVTGGSLAIVSKDDGINATITTGEAITLSGGNIYIYASGDGIDANTTTSYSGIIFSGSNVVVVSTSGGNSAIDTERGFTYKSGKVLAIMPGNAMVSESSNCSNFSSIGTKKTSLSLTQNNYISITVDGSVVCNLKLPTTISSATAIYLGSNSASMTISQNSSHILADSGVYWN